MESPNEPNQLRISPFRVKNLVKKIHSLNITLLFIVPTVGPKLFVELLIKRLSSRGPHSTMDSALASHPAAPGLIPGIPKNFSEE